MHWPVYKHLQILIEILEDLLLHPQELRTQTTLDYIHRHNLLMQEAMVSTTSIDDSAKTDLGSLFRSLITQLHPFHFNPTPPVLFHMTLQTQTQHTLQNLSFFSSPPTIIQFRDSQELFIYYLVLRPAHNPHHLLQLLHHLAHTSSSSSSSHSSTPLPSLSLHLTYSLLQYHGQTFLPKQAEVVLQGQETVLLGWEELAAAARVKSRRQGQGARASGGAAAGEGMRGLSG